MTTTQPVRVAVIGGGCAAVTTAFELSRPEHEGRYEVTIYQLGHRLGGKGASGRGPRARIEEHGLHLWMGFYENAFRLMREAYAAAERDPKSCPLARWTDAFVPDPACGIMDRTPDGEWLPWTVVFPPGPGLPGDSLEAPTRWTLADYVVRTTTLLRTLLEAIRLRAPGGAAPEETSGSYVGPSAWPSAGTSVGASVGSGTSAAEAMEAIRRIVQFGQIATLTASVQALSLLESVLRGLPSVPTELMRKFVDLVGNAARAQIGTLVERDHEARRLWEIIDLSLAMLRGIFRFGLLTHPNGLDAIDDYDCRQWLRQNGASARSVDSGFVRGLYDLAFAYEDGDVTRPRVAAGQAVRGALRAFFTYRGAFFWKMQAGMGDVVFAPVYEVLKARGVRFAFFHRVEDLALADLDGLAPGEGPHVAAIDVDVQAEVKGGGEYRPLVAVGGVPSWPAEPDWTQLVDGDRLRREGVQFESFWDQRRHERVRLEVGKDFDIVVLGVGVGAVRHICRELIAHDVKWRTMVDHVKSVPTQAFQVWLSPSARELGWTAPATSISGFVEPYDTWADMSHLREAERWPEGPGSIAYFCSVLPASPRGDNREDVEFAAEQRDIARRNAVDFLNRDVHHLWPAASRSEGEFRWELLLDHETGAAEDGPATSDRFATQFWTANVNPSDRYTLALPGTLRHRISPLDRTFDNLTICGDWTDCGFNEGCVEAAVMSGLLAAHAVSLSPPLASIVGFDHP